VKGISSNDVLLHDCISANRVQHLSAKGLPITFSPKSAIFPCFFHGLMNDAYFRGFHMYMS
jgi:hypothetical protein